MAAQLSLARSAACIRFKTQAMFVSKSRVAMFCKAGDNHIRLFKMPLAPAAEHAEHTGPIDYNFCQESARNSLGSMDCWAPSDSVTTTSSQPMPAPQEESISFINCWELPGDYPVNLDAETSRCSMDSMDIWSN